MIKLLNDEERAPLKSIFRDEFNSMMPDAGQANIVAVVENGEIQAFLLSEVLISTSVIWVKERKTTKAARKIKDMIAYVRKSVPIGSSVISIGYKDRLFESLGMRKIDGHIYRRDF